MAVALRMLLTGLAAAFILTGLWNLASAWVFHADLRKASNFAPVGVIEFSLPEGRSRGTAFLVGECGVMTNFHVVFGPWYLTALRPPSSANRGTFTLTQVTLPNGEHPSTGAIPVIWGDYTGPDRQFRRPANDWVVLALEKCLGDLHGYLQPYDAALNGDIQESGGFIAIGYSAGRQMVDSNCSIRRRSDSLTGTTMLNDCASLPGDSGAPIVMRGTSRVIAMVSSSHAGFGSSRCSSLKEVVHEHWNAQCTNAAIPFTAALIDQIGAVRCAIQAQNMLLRLGYAAGPYGLLNRPQMMSAIRQAQLEMGMIPSGDVSCTLSKLLKMRTLGI
jgi:hypothetical protein